VLSGCRAVVSGWLCSGSRGAGRGESAASKCASWDPSLALAPPAVIFPPRAIGVGNLGDRTYLQVPKLRNDSLSTLPDGVDVAPVHPRQELLETRSHQRGIVGDHLSGVVNQFGTNTMSR
jgi:hypothetical protein